MTRFHHYCKNKHKGAGLNIAANKRTAGHSERGCIIQVKLGTAKSLFIHKKILLWSPANNTGTNMNNKVTGIFVRPNIKDEETNVQMMMMMIIIFEEENNYN